MTRTVRHQSDGLPHPEAQVPAIQHHRYGRAVARATAPAPQRYRSCGKRFYADRISADLALAVIRARGQVRGKEPVRSYPCPHCGGWHLTAAPTWRPLGVPSEAPRRRVGQVTTDQEGNS
jgi:hypothetical protein